MRHTPAVLFPLLLLLFTAPLARAETRYVIDALVISVRTSPTEQAELIRSIRSGEAVEVLEETRTHLRLRLADGTQGWSLKQYFSPDKPAVLLLAQAQQERDQARQQMEEMKRRQEETRGKIQTTSATAASLEQDLAKTRQELADLTRRHTQLTESARDVVAVNDERNRLKEQTRQLTEQLATLQEQYDTLLRAQIKGWLATGGGLVFGGWLIGRLSRQKRRY